MRFAIERASGKDGEQPCKEAVRERYLSHDVRIAHDPSDLPEPLRSTWLQEGTNHRTKKDGTIVRDLGEHEAWFIYLNTLQELVALRRRYGDLILTSHDWMDDPVITIYDDWVE